MDTNDTQDTTNNIENLDSLINTSSHEAGDLSSMNTSAKKINIKMVSTIFGVLLVLGLIGFGVYYYMNSDSSLVISPLSGDSKKVESKGDMVANPLNGELFPKAEGEELFKTRPLAVMVNNHVDARPQSGLIYADLIYEIVAEGGITRYLAFFNSNIPEKIGPVRSTREYYLVLVKELGDAMLMHIGWSPQALEAIETWPVRSLGRGGGTFWRDNPRNVATEHTAYVNGKDLVELGVSLGWDGTSEMETWEYKEDGLPSGSTATPATDVLIDFWYHGDYSSIWKYNAENNTYMRSIGYDENESPIPLKDQETQEQVAVKNLIIQFATESNIEGDDKGRLEYALVGSGEGLVFIDGVVYPVTWSKEDRDSRTFFYDQEGNSFKFNRGKMWIAIVPDRNVDQVVYE